MKVLQLTHRVPFPPTDGGAIGIYNITKGLVENGCEIDLVAINTPKHSQPKDAMLGIVKNQYDVFVDTKIAPFKLLGNLFFRKTPYNVERFISIDVSRKLIELLKANTYDFIQLESAFVVSYIDVIRNYTTTPILVRTHNIEYVIWDRLALNTRNPFKKWFYKHLSKRLKRFEAIYYNKADGIAAITVEDEQRLVKIGVEKKIAVIPAGVVLKIDKVKVEQKQGTIFSISALDWIPNIEGLYWFLEKVWPLLLAKRPDTFLHIAGKSTPEWLFKTNYPNTTIHGFVDDAYLFNQSYQIMLVPLLSGGGMRVKIVEGLAQGKCIISTTIGAEGIDYENKKNIVIADTPIDWVENISYYLDNPEARKEMEVNAEVLAHSHYENKAITKKYVDLFKSIK